MMSTWACVQNKGSVNMKTEQILLALEISRCGSVSKAASNLFMAQPNASNSLALLEQELGYQIFERTYNGMKVTKQGEAFLQYACAIERNMQKMYRIREQETRVRLSVVTYAYPFAERAFTRFCVNYIDTAHSLKCRLRRIGMVSQGVEYLQRDEADVAMVTCRQELYGQFEADFKKEGLYSEVLAHTTLNVVMPETHPLAGRETVDLQEYAKYPCISNEGLDKNYAPPEVEELLRQVDLHIVMEPGRARYELLEDSDSFVICTPYQVEELRRHHLVEKKIPNANRNLVLLMKEENQHDQQIQRYVSLLKDEIRVWEQEIR